MGFFNRYIPGPGPAWPYTNMQQINLDWIIYEVKTLGHNVEEYKTQLDQLGVSVDEFRDYIENIDDEIQQKINTEIPAFIQQAIDQGLFNDVLTAARVRRVVVIGDSYGAGWTPDGDVTGFPTVIKNMLHLSDSNFFTENKGGARFGAAVNSEYAFDTVLAGLLENITHKETITDIIFAGGYNEGASSYESINEGIARCKTLIGLNFTNPSLKVYLFSVGYHCSDPAQRNKLYRRYVNSYARSGWAYTHLTPAICYSDWWASDGYHPLQAAQNAIAYNIVNIINGGTNTSVPVVEEYASTNVNNMVWYSLMTENGLDSFLFNREISFANAITLNRTTPVKILEITSKLPLSNISDANLRQVFTANAVIGMGNVFTTTQVILYIEQTARNTFGLYASIFATNEAGNNYLTLENVNSIQFQWNSVHTQIPYEF